MSSMQTHELSSGLIVVAETKKNVESCSIRWVFPAGSCTDAEQAVGCSTMLSEMILRGAGDLDSRALSASMDRCGMRRSADLGIHHLSLSATSLGCDLMDMMGFLVSVVRDPHLPPEALEPVRSLCLQSLESLQDDPQHEVMLRVRYRHRKSPFNRNGFGDQRALESMTLDAIRDAWTTRMVPAGSILAVTGSVDLPALLDGLESSLSNWEGQFEEPGTLDDGLRGSEHIERDAAQVHIGMAWDAPPESHPHAMLQRVATRVFSVTSSGRLFTEVRQKRSLCYSVNAVYQAGRDTGVIGLYAGTTPDRAQETLDTCIAEYNRMAEGITEEEFQRVLVGLESSLVLAGESVAARSAALVSDQFRLGRTRSLDQLRQEIAQVGLDDVNEYLASRVESEPTIVTMGPVALKTPT